MKHQILKTAYSTNNKQEELVAAAQLESYEPVTVTEIGQAKTHDLDTATDGWKLLRRDRQGKMWWRSYSLCKKIGLTAQSCL